MPIATFILTWQLQDLFSIVLFLYWQVKGQTQQLRATFARLLLEQSPSERTILRRTVFKFVVAVLVIFTLLGLLNVADLVDTYHGDENQNTTDVKLFSKLDLNQIAPLSALLNQIVTCIALIVVCYFDCCCLVLVHSITCFTNRLRSLGSYNSGSEPRLSDALAKSLHSYATLVDAVRALDRVFDVYLFCMLALKIPSSIFMLLKCLTGFKSSWTNFGFNASELAYSLVDLMAVTVMPARVHALMRRVETNLYANRHLMSSRDERVNSIIALFVEQCRQPELGLSMCGFTVMTKSVMLKIIVAIITYLLIFIQLYPDWASVLDDLDWYS